MQTKTAKNITWKHSLKLLFLEVCFTLSYFYPKSRSLCLANPAELGAACSYVAQVSLDSLLLSPQEPVSTPWCVELIETTTEKNG